MTIVDMELAVLDEQQMLRMMGASNKEMARRLGLMAGGVSVITFRLKSIDAHLVITGIGVNDVRLRDRPELHARVLTRGD